MASAFPEHLGDSVIDYVAKRVAGISRASTRDHKFRESRYRLEMTEESDGAIDGKFYVDARAMRSKSAIRARGAGVLRMVADINIELGYNAKGGHERGDRKTISRRAMSDCHVVADLLEEPTESRYDNTNTGIVAITFQPEAARALSESTREIWVVRFQVEWESAVLR